ncbi:MAG TPA: hypothetical protein VJB16_02770, partial [archaeon]|nr:hypothetical protein [archaeon]
AESERQHAETKRGLSESERQHAQTKQELREVRQTLHDMQLALRDGQVTTNLREAIRDQYDFDDDQHLGDMLADLCAHHPAAKPRLLRLLPARRGARRPPTLATVHRILSGVSTRRCSVAHTSLDELEAEVRGRLAELAADGTDAELLLAFQLMDELLKIMHDCQGCGRKINIFPTLWSNALKFSIFYNSMKIVHF